MAQRNAMDQYRFKNEDSVPEVPTRVLRNFLKGWDDSTDENDSYLSYIQPDAILYFGGAHEGMKGFKAARDGMIHQRKGPILRSAHFFETAFVNAIGSGSWEIIGTSDIRYDLVDGNEVWTRAASWCRVVKTDGDDGLISKYEVFMDGSKLFEAMSKLKK
jgi:hypothetical protein